VLDFANLDVFAWSDPPLDSRFQLRRSDVCVYTTEKLEQPIDVSGQAFFDGFVSADCPDTDLAVGLYDVYPDGRSIVLGSRSIHRLAYRNGAQPEPLPVGTPVEVHMPVTWLHHRFLPGHRIRLAISSSAFPIHARNFNNGEPWPDAVEPRIARVTIHRGARYPSSFVLPVEQGAR
jgi:putative CocE/NonD family hydrolase